MIVFYLFSYGGQWQVPGGLVEINLAFYPYSPSVIVHWGSNFIKVVAHMDNWHHLPLSHMAYRVVYRRISDGVK